MWANTYYYALGVTMTDKPHVDDQMLNSLKELLGEKFVQLITAFIFDCKGRFTRLKSASLTADLDTIKDESHGIKGSCRNIGANPLADICSDIENQARAGNADGLEQKISAAEQLFAALCEDLKTHLP